MKYTVTGAQAKRIDSDSIRRVGIPSIVLMERAALSVADAVCSFFHAEADPIKSDEEGKTIPGARTVLIACGTGNNGADGIAAGRILSIRGYDVTLLLVGNPEHATEEHRMQEQIARNLGIRICAAADSGQLAVSCAEWEASAGVRDSEDHMPHSAFGVRKEAPAVIVDALFGIGLSREVGGVYRETMEWLSGFSDAKTVAVDIPSGIHADTGAVMGIALRADVTVTFGKLKTGLMLYPGRQYAGEVRTAEIGFAPESMRLAGTDAAVLTSADLAALPVRRPDANKGTFGRLLIIAGSEGMSGAAYLSALGAYRMGAGLVKILTVESNRPVLQTGLPEAIVTSYDPERILAFMDRPEDAAEEDPDNYLDEEKRLESQEGFQEFIEGQCTWADVIVLGPGLGQEPYVVTLVETVLERAYVPIVLDADGLNTIARHSYLTRYLTENMIVTPHVGEMSRLTGLSVQELKSAPLQAARAYSAQTGAVCVLKDASTVIADKDGTAYINESGCSAMAKGGSGDVLSGVIGALLAQGMDGAEAAAFGVYVHGLAGQLAAAELGARGVLAHDIADRLPQAAEGGGFE